MKETVRLLFALLLLVSCSPKAEAPKQFGKLVPSEWAPSLEQVLEDVGEGAAAQPNTSQRALNRAGQNMADLRDAQLFITYVLLMQRVEDTKRADLFDEQSAWLARRSESARAAVVSKGGSLEPLEYATAFSSITDKRLAELNSRLRQQPSPAEKPR